MATTFSCGRRSTRCSCRCCSGGKAPDGSRVLALRIWKNYDGDADMVRRRPRAHLPRDSTMALSSWAWAITAARLRRSRFARLLEMQKDRNLPELRFSTLAEFFNAVETSPAFASLPVVKDELQIHATGCYSAYGEGKYPEPPRRTLAGRGGNHLAAGQPDHGHARTRQSSSRNPGGRCSSANSTT